MMSFFREFLRSKSSSTRSPRKYRPTLARGQCRHGQRQEILGSIFAPSSILRSTSVPIPQGCRQSSSSATWPISAKRGVGKASQSWVLRFCGSQAMRRGNFREVFRGPAWEPDGVSTGPLVRGSMRGLSEGSGGASTPFREHGPAAYTTALGSPPSRDPVPAPGRSGSAPHAPPA